MSPSSWSTFEFDPRRMATMAALHGVKPPPVAGATVIELGAADAADLLSIADGGADYVVASDVLTRIDDETRASVIAQAARIARRGGLVMLSYDVSPGALGRTLTRSIGRRAAKAAIDAGDAEAARDAVVARLRVMARTALAGSDFATLAASEAQRVEQSSPERLLHHELSEHWEPLAVSEVAEQAARSGLAYLGELQPSDRWRERLAAADVGHVTKLAGAPQAAQQQLVDDMLGATFHASLFVRGAAPREPIGGGLRRPTGPPAARWHVSTQYTGEWPELPADLAAVAEQLVAAGPAGLTVGEIAQRASQSADAVRQAASILDAHGLARLDLEPAPAASASG